MTIISMVSCKRIIKWVAITKLDFRVRKIIVADFKRSCERKISNSITDFKARMIQQRCHISVVETELQATNRVAGGR